jgi:hypothetical protein
LLIFSGFLPRQSPALREPRLQSCAHGLRSAPSSRLLRRAICRRRCKPPAPLMRRQLHQRALNLGKRDFNGPVGATRNQRGKQRPQHAYLTCQRDLQRLAHERFGLALDERFGKLCGAVARPPRPAQPITTLAPLKRPTARLLRGGGCLPRFFSPTAKRATKPLARPSVLAGRWRCAPRSSRVGASLSFKLPMRMPNGYAHGDDLLNCILSSPHSRSTQWGIGSPANCSAPPAPCVARAAIRLVGPQNPNPPIPGLRQLRPAADIGRISALPERKTD